MVKSPKHYQSKFEVIDIIEAFNLNFNIGNVCKYILRAGKKDPNKIKQDYQKAAWYLIREHNKSLPESEQQIMIDLSEYKELIKLKNNK